MRRREVFLKPCVEACFPDLKIVATSEEFHMHGFEIRTYFLRSYLQFVYIVTAYY